jgi:hypothetical protein
MHAELAEQKAAEDRAKEADGPSCAGDRACMGDPGREPAGDEAD